MTTPWLPLRDRLRRDDGFTLIEMVCAMVGLSVLLVAVAAIFLTDVKVTGQTKARLDQTNQGRVAMDSMTRVLRTAVIPASLASCTKCGAEAAFVSGDAFDVAFYADIDNDEDTVGPSQVTISVNSSDQLIETVRPADPGSAGVGFTWKCTLGTPGCTKRTTVLASGVDTGGPNLFTYYEYGSATPLTGTLTVAQLADVDAVDVSLTTAAPGHTNVAPTTFVSRVSLPNVDTVVEASIAPGGGP